MKRYLLDTSFLIEYLRHDNEKIKDFLRREDYCISSVTVAELIQGVRSKRELFTLVESCENITEMYIDKKISREAIELLKKFNLSEGLMFLDALIATTALENKLTLVTANLKHFRKIKGLNLLDQKSLVN